MIPATGANSVDFESSDSIIEHGHFSQDPILTKLLTSREIEKISLKTFKTVGSSRYWNHMYSDLSYRDLLFNDITDDDRWRSYAWIIHSTQIKRLLKTI